MTGWELSLLYIAWLVAGGGPGPARLACAGAAMPHGRDADAKFRRWVDAGPAAQFGDGGLRLIFSGMEPS